MFFEKLFGEKNREDFNEKIIELREKIDKNEQKILNLKNENSKLIQDIEDLKIYNKNFLKLNKFYSQLILKLNDSNDDINYIYIINEIKKFIKENYKHLDKDIFNNIYNHQTGKKGEEQVYKILENLKNSKKEFEFLYDLNLISKDKKSQFDFIVIAPSSKFDNEITIRLIEVKKYNLEELNICENDIKVKYRSKTISFRKIDELYNKSELEKIKIRYEIMQQISKEFLKENIKINWFNIIAFTDYNNSILDKTIINGEKVKQKDFDNKQLHYINYENLRIGVLIGNKNIEGNFKQFIPNYSEYNQSSKDLAFYLKNCLKCKYSTDKRWIVDSIIKTFNEIYKELEKDCI